MLRHDLFLTPGESADINWRERLSFQEISFLVGLMVKHPINFSLPSDESVVKNQVNKMHDLFEELHWAHHESFFKKLFEGANQNLEPEEAEKSHSDFFGSGDLMTEPIFYGGSGAYDFQYLEFAERKYKNDVEWITRNKGVQVDKMTKLAAGLKKLNEGKINTFPNAESFEEFCKGMLDIFCFSKEDISQFRGRNGKKIYCHLLVNSG